MIEIKAVTYEEARREYLEEQMQKAQRKIKYWESRIDRSRPHNMRDPAAINAADCGWEYNFYKDALEALENNKFQYETGFVKGFEAAQPKWISVEERLPGDPLDGVGEVVELLVNKGSAKEVLPGYYDHNEKDWVIYFGDISGGHRRKYFSWWHVIKWRPLPEAPKEEA